jgi:hypothetical protein
LVSIPKKNLVLKERMGQNSKMAFIGAGCGDILKLLNPGIPVRYSSGLVGRLENKE